MATTATSRPQLRPPPPKTAPAAEKEKYAEYVKAAEAEQELKAGLLTKWQEDHPQPLSDGRKRIDAALRAIASGRLPPGANGRPVIDLAATPLRASDLESLSSCLSNGPAGLITRLALDGCNLLGDAGGKALAGLLESNAGIVSVTATGCGFTAAVGEKLLALLDPSGPRNLAIEVRSMAVSGRGGHFYPCLSFFTHTHTHSPVRWALPFLGPSVSRSAGPERGREPGHPFCPPHRHHQGRDLQPESVRAHQDEALAGGLLPCPQGGRPRRFWHRRLQPVRGRLRGGNEPSGTLPRPAGQATHHTLLVRLGRGRS